MNKTWEGLIRLSLSKKRPKKLFPDTSGASYLWLNQCTAAPTALEKCVFGTPCIQMWPNSNRALSIHIYLCQQSWGCSFFLKIILSLCCIKDSSTDDPAPRSYGFGCHKKNVAACFEVLICVFCRLPFSYQDRMWVFDGEVAQVSMVGNIYLVFGTN